MSVSPETIVQVNIWREKAKAGTLTQDEMREAIKFLRAERLAMPAPSKTRAKPQVDTNTLFGELDNL